MSLLSDIKNGDVSSLADRVTGPSFNYAGNIRSPASLGVGSAGNMGQIFTNTGAVLGYVDQLIRQPLLGNQTFVQTGGTCRLPNGSVVPRWSWVDNRLGGSDGLPQSVANGLGGVTSQFNGIIPGMFGDIAAMNPARLFSALTMNGVPDCEEWRCPVTTSTGVPSGFDVKPVVLSLEPHVQSKCTRAPIRETFMVASTTAAPFFNSQYSPRRVEVSGGLTEYILYGIAGLAIVAMAVISQKHTFAR
jgi:hypothetical protein